MFAPSPVAVLAAFTFLALTLSAPAAPPPFTVGVCTHFSQDKGLLASNLSLIRQAGIASIRDEVVWRTIEREKDRLEMPADWDLYVTAALAAGLQPLLILDYGNPFYDNGDKPRSPEALEGFARYSEFIARHFKGKVRHYEVWNEFDIKIGGGTPGSPEEYMRVLKAVYPRLKAIDPSITVYGGAMTPSGVRNGWLEKMLAAGALPYLDVVSIHTYNYGRSGREGTPEGWAEWMAQVGQLIARYNQGRPAPLHITEMGWPTQLDPRGTPPRLAAAYLARMFLLARTLPFLRGIWWYDFQDDGWKAPYNEHNFGLVRPDLSPKPAYSALADIAALVAKAEYLGRVDAGDPEVFILKFRDPARKDVWALWSAHPDDDWQITLKTSAATPQPLSVREAGSGALERPWGSRDWPEQRRAPVLSDQLEILVRGTPWLLSGDLSTVTVAGVRQRPFPEATRPQPAAKKKTILVVEADMADGEWGAGGVIFQALRDGHRVVVVQMVSDYSNWPTSQGKEQIVAEGLARIAKQMGVIQIPLGYKYHHTPVDVEVKRRIAEICAQYEPDIAITHVETDFWSDHVNTARSAKDGILFAHGYLAKPVKRPERILTFSVAANQTYAFQPDIFVDITDVIERVVWVHNEIEWLLTGGPKYTSWLTLEGPAQQGYPKKLGLGSHAENVLAIDRRYGAMCGVRYAEAFQSVIRTPQKLW